MHKETTMITLTETATTKVAQLIEAEGAGELALRVAVKSGGCSGFSYDMYFDSEIAPDDEVLTFGAVRVVVDPASAPMLVGASLDYKDSLTEAGFSISNPNASRSCGCGKSFS
jgi:iron-sulfur cluster assembly protein/iron-sulfur cluster insertion protein